MVGLEEGPEASEANKELNNILRYILDLKDTDAVPEVERHHQTPRPHPGPSEPPRPYILRMLRWTDRQDILRSAGGGGANLERKAVPVFQDLPVDIKKQRADFANIKNILRGTGIQYGMLYPARLIVTIEGEKIIYNNSMSAKRDLRVRLPAIFR